MSAWIVYSKDGKTQRCELKRLEYSGSHMGERAVTATFEYHSEVAFDVFDYIVYRDEKFELESIPSVKKVSSNEYEYELRFVSLKYELERCEMRDIVPNDNGVVYPTPLTFSFTGDVRYLADRIQANLDALYGKGVWSIVVANGVSSDEKNISIAQQNCWNALSLVNTTYGLNFSVRGREVVIGGEIDAVSHTFQYGKGNGLYEIERASDTDTGIVTKLRAYGSTKNLDYSYPKKPEWADSVLPVSFALSPLRLVLPSFKEDGKTDYVLADDAVISKYGIREASIVYDDIYPSIAGAKNSSGQAIDEIASVDAVNEELSTFTVYLHDLGFDLEEHLTTTEAQLSMKTGTLQGYTFNISAIDRQGNGGYKLTLGRNSIEGSEESGFNVPNKDWNMKAGDKFVLLNILMPQAYIREAEARLLVRAKEYLAEYGKTNFSYNVGLHDKFLVEHPSVYNSLIEGVKLRVHDSELGISEDVIIQSITITENSDDNILPQVKVTLNNKPSASTLDRIQGKLNDVIAETSANNFSSQSELMAQYRKKLDKPFFDKLFVAIDKDGNEIASNDVATPVSYIKAKYSIATVGGVTMYAEDDVEVPTLAEGLPFDQRTIWFNPDTKQIEVIGGTGGGEGGVSNFWDLSGIPSWITNTKPVYNYSEIQNTPDLSGYATTSSLNAVSTKLNDFLEGSDTDTVINKWKELETLLSGLTESDNLATILTGKADKSYVDTNFVTIAGTEDVTGLHNFVNGLKVGGIELIQKNGNAFLKGNLVVEGGITMYGDGDGGSSVPLYSTLGSLLNVDESNDAVASVDRVLFQSAGSNVWSWKALSEIGGGSSGGSVSGDYLPLSGGTLSGNLYFSGYGSGSYQIGVIGANAEGFNINGVWKYNDPTKGRMPINISWRGGFETYGGLKITDYSDAYLGSYQILHSGNYSSYSLPLTGGSLSGMLTVATELTGITINNTRSGRTPHITFQSQGTETGAIGISSSNVPQMYNASKGTWHTFLTDDNYSSYALPLSGGTCNWINIDYTNSLDAENSVFIIKRKDRGRFLEFQGDVGFFKCVYNFTHTSTNVDIHVFNKGTSYISKLQTASVCPNLDISGGSVTIGGWEGSKFYFDTENIRLGIGTPKPNKELHVVGDIYASKSVEATDTWTKVYHAGGGITYSANTTGYFRFGTFDETDGGLKMQFGGTGTTGTLQVIDQAWKKSLFKLDKSGNVVVAGGITMYSDIRKKTKLQDIELSLSQIANAPLIQHYYNTDEVKTTHVGSIAQYWAGLNDWFCKLDNEGFYTMEIQNCALASAISIARHLEKYESKTDKTIRKMKQRIQELEDEVERLKNN